MEVMALCLLANVLCLALIFKAAWELEERNDKDDKEETWFS